MTNRQSDPNRVRVYWNLTSHVFSVQKYVKGTGWRLSHHTDYINLGDVKFICSHATRLRVIAKGKKYVHAYFEGFTLDDPYYIMQKGSNPDKPFLGNEITYNPLKFPCFADVCEWGLFPSYEYKELNDRSILNSFWDLNDLVPRKYCEVLTMSIIDQKPKMISGIRR